MKCSKVSSKRCIEGFGRETSGKDPLGKPRHRWEDNIKMGLQKNSMGRGMDCIDLGCSGQGQMADSCENSNELLGS
jgi:hypothetical protein